MERIGIADDALVETFHCKDPVTHIISLNLRRRHLTKAQQTDLIIAAVKAGADYKPRQVGEVSKGGRGKVDEIKAAVVEAAAEHGISKRTAERRIAKAEGKTPKPASRKPKPGTPIIIEHDDDEDFPNTGCNYDPADPRGFDEFDSEVTIRRRAWLVMAHHAMYGGVVHGRERSPRHRRG